MVAGGIYLVAVSILFLHGLLIWQNSFQRVVAILVGVVILGVTYLMVRKGAFARRMVIEVRQDPAVIEQAGSGWAILMESVCTRGLSAPSRNLVISAPLHFMCL
jgi:positive regulator of sigma E activity